MNNTNMDKPPVPQGINFIQEHELAKTGQPNSKKYIQYIVEKMSEDVDLSDQELDVLQNPSNKESFTTLLNQKQEEALQQKEVVKSENTVLEAKTDTEATGEKAPEKSVEEEEEYLKPLSFSDTESEENDKSVAKRTREDILATLKAKQEKSVKLLQKVQNEPTERIQDARDSMLQEREAYLNKYGEQVDTVNGFKKAAYKIGSWFGINKKDGFIDKNLKDTYNLSKKDLENTVFEEFASENVNERFRAKKEAARKQAIENGEVFDEKAYDEYLENVKARYAQTLIKERRTTHADFGQENITDRLIKNDPDYFQGTSDALERSKQFAEQKNRLRGVNLKFVTNENEQLRAAKEKTWEANKNDAEKRLEKVSEYLEKNRVYRNTLGSKWFRFGIKTVTIGMLTGGYGVVNQFIRAGGGLIGGAVGKFIGSKLINEEKILTKRLAELEAKYKAEKVDVGFYDEEREKIDAVLRTYARAKKTLIIAGAIGGGIGAGAAANYVEHNIPFDTQDNTETNGGTENKTNTETGNKTPNPVVDTNPETGGSNVVESSTPPDYSIVEAHSGHGVEHALTADIENNPTLATKLGWDGTEDLHKFAQGEAHRIAISEGYVDPKTGAERWVYGDKNVSYNLRMEGTEIVVDEKVLENGTWVSYDQIDSQNDIFEKDTDTSTDNNIYEKTHTRYVPEHHTAPHPIENTGKPYTGEDEITMEDSTVEEAPTATEIMETPPRAEVVELPPKAEVMETPPKADPVIPHPTDVGYRGPELPRTYGGGPEESGYGFPGPGRTMTGGGQGVELPRTHGGVNGGGGIFEDILRLILGGR